MGTLRRQQSWQLWEQCCALLSTGNDLGQLLCSILGAQRPGHPEWIAEDIFISLPAIPLSYRKILVLGEKLKWGSCVSPQGLVSTLYVLMERVLAALR